jgi:hypothetical protein
MEKLSSTHRALARSFHGTLENTVETEFMLAKIKLYIGKSLYSRWMKKIIILRADSADTALMICVFICKYRSQTL